MDISSLSNSSSASALSSYYAYLQMLEAEQAQAAASSATSATSGNASQTDSVSISNAALSLASLLTPTDDAAETDPTDLWSSLFGTSTPLPSYSSLLENTDDDGISSILNGLLQQTGSIPGLSDNDMTDVSDASSLTPEQLAQARAALVAQAKDQDRQILLQYYQYAPAIAAYEQNFTYEGASL